MKYYFFLFRHEWGHVANVIAILDQKKKKIATLNRFLKENFFLHLARQENDQYKVFLKSNKFDNWLKSRNNKWNFDPFPNMVKAETYFSDLWAVQECFVYLIKIAPKSVLKRNKVRKYPFKMTKNKWWWHIIVLKQCMITLMVTM